MLSYRGWDILSWNYYSSLSFLLMCTSFKSLSLFHPISETVFPFRNLPQDTFFSTVLDRQINLSLNCFQNLTSHSTTSYYTYFFLTTHTVGFLLLLLLLFPLAWEIPHTLAFILILLLMIYPDSAQACLSQGKYVNYLTQSIPFTKYFHIINQPSWSCPCLDN